MTEPSTVAKTTSFVKSKAVSTKNFIKKHRVAIAITATSIVWSSLAVRNVNNLNEFLEEHDLLETYYEVDPADLDEVAALHGN